MHPTPFHRLLGELHQHSYFPIFSLFFCLAACAEHLDAKRTKTPRRNPTTLSLLTSLSSRNNRDLRLTREREEPVAQFFEITDHFLHGVYPDLKLSKSMLSSSFQYRGSAGELQTLCKAGLHSGSPIRLRRIFPTLPLPALVAGGRGCAVSGEMQKRPPAACLGVLSFAECSVCCMAFLPFPCFSCPFDGALVRNTWTLKGPKPPGATQQLYPSGPPAASAGGGVPGAR